MFYFKLWLILFSIINSLSIQATPALEQVGQLSLSNKSYQINGQYLYAAGCGGFEVFDLVDPLKPNLLANLPIAMSGYNCASKIIFNHSYAYVLNVQSIEIIDISTPTAPKRIGNYEIPRNNSDSRIDFVIAEQYAYLAIPNEILVLDLSNPTRPALVANKVFDTGSFFKMKANGEQLVVRKTIINYQTDVTDEILFFNLKKPTQFEQIGSILLEKLSNILDYAICDFSISGQYLYAISLNGDILSVNISDPTKPQQIGKYVLGDRNWYTNIIASEKSLYYLRGNTGNESSAGDSTSKVFVFDTSNPAQLTLTTTYKMAYNYSNVGDSFIYKQNLYITKSNNEPTIILDISQPSQIKEIGKILDNYTGWMSGLSKGNTVYVINSNISKKLLTIDISNPSLPKLANALNFDELNNYYNSSLAIDNNYLYFCNERGLYTFDITNPLQPKKVGEFLLSNGYSCADIMISGKYAYLTQNPFGLTTVSNTTKIVILDISNPTQLNKLGEYPMSNRYLKKLIAKDGKVYVLAQSTQAVNFTTYDYLHILDASNPSELKELSNYELPITQNINIVLIGQYAYFSGSYRLHIVDISNASSPKAAGNYSNNSWKSSSGFNIVSTGNNFLYATDYNGLFKLDISNPLQPKQVAQILPASDYAYSILANEPYVYRLTQYGVQVFKSVEVEAPQMTQIKGLANGACDLNLSAKMLGADDGTGKNAGDFYLQWKETGRESTSSGDAVIAGYFYAPSEKVTWGSEANPEVYAKLWFSVNGMLNVNFFHVGVFDVQLGSSYGADMPQLNGGSALDHNKITIGRKAWRYSRHDYTNWRSCGKTDSALGNLKVEELPRLTLKEMAASNAKFTTSVFKLPSTSAAKININQQGSCELLMDAKMLNATNNGKPYGNLKLQWKEVLRSTTSGGDTVIAGYFYASPNEVSWGSTTNPEAYVKIWYARNGLLNVNFFHVGVFDIELTSSYKGVVSDGIDGYLTDDNNFINIWSDANRYARHDYNNWKLCN
jgi:hypothetical protein